MLKIEYNNYTVSNTFQFLKHFFVCDLSGEVLNPKDRCKKCQGKKVVKESKILEVKTVHA